MDQKPGMQAEALRHRDGTQPSNRCHGYPPQIVALRHPGPGMFDHSTNQMPLAGIRVRKDSGESTTTDYRCGGDACDLLSGTQASPISLHLFKCPCPEIGQCCINRRDSHNSPYDVASTRLSRSLGTRSGRYQRVDSDGGVSTGSSTAPVVVGEGGVSNPGSI